MLSRDETQISAVCSEANLSYKASAAGIHLPLLFNNRDRFKSLTRTVFTRKCMKQVSLIMQKYGEMRKTYLNISIHLNRED